MTNKAANKTAKFKNNNLLEIKNIIELCKINNIKITKRRETIIKAILDLNSNHQHPDTEEIYFHTKKDDESASIATVYRFLAELDEKKIIEKHNFDNNKARYEFSSNSNHHDHLIDIESGEIIEFFNQEIENLKIKIASDYGYKLVDHRLDLKCIKIKK